MATPDHGGEPPVTPLDAERARLRAKGWSEEKIEQILYDREVNRSSSESSQAAPSGPIIQGPPMSGVLGNVNAAMHHARVAIPVLKADLENLRDSTAPRKSRGTSALKLLGAAGIIAVICFAVYQEWQQHIIAATEIQNAQVRKIQAEADAAKALNDAQVKKLEAEAAVAKQVNEAQATKLKADAAVADEVAAGAKAKSCSERLELMTKNMIPDDFDNSGGSLTVKPGTATARMMDKYNRECGEITGSSDTDPNFKEEHDKIYNNVGKMYQGIKKLALDTKKPFQFDDIDAAIQSTCLIGVRVSTGLKLGDQSSATDMVGESLPICSGAVVAYKFAQLGDMPLDAPADLSTAPDDATRNLWRSKSVAADIKQCADSNPNYMDFLACSCIAGAKFGVGKVITNNDEQAKRSLMEQSDKICQHMSAKFAELDGPAAAKKYHEFPKLIDLLKMTRAEKAGDYGTAFAAAKRYAAATEADEIKESGSAGKKTSEALVTVAWNGLFTQKFQESLEASDRSLALTPSDLVPTTNRAHALMFLGRTEEARAIYRAHVGEPLQGKKWENVIVEDFAKLRAAKLTNPLMAEIEAAFPPSPAPTATDSPTARSPAPSPTPTPSYTALATPEPSPSAETRAPTTYDNYDLAGNDLEHMASDSIEACLSACRDNSLCRGVTFDKWNKLCFLKSEAKTLWFNAHGVSAYIDRSATPDYADAPMYIMRVPGRGFPKTGSTNYAESADACDDTCRTTSWCAADTFFRSTHECMMLQTTGEYFPNSDADAGIKRQKNY